MKRIGISFALAVGLFAGATAINPNLVKQAAAQSSTTGAVRGRIIDKASKEPVIGATVSVSGPALQGLQSEITDENGGFSISNLPPGTYIVSVFYGEAQFDRPNLTIEVGKQPFISVPIDTTIKPGEVIELEGRAPIVDQGSTKIGPTITDEYTRNIPTGRTFGAVLGTAAGTTSDQYGVSFSGSTSVESSYVVEGINTTDTAFGGQSTNLPNEFVEETEVIAGGYSAEFGRSTGGVVNVVTKQGGNKFKGSIFGYYTPGKLVSDAKSILREGSSVGSELNLNQAADVGFELGGPILKDKLWFHVGYNPSFTQDTFDRITSQNVDKVDLNGAGIGTDQFDSCETDDNMNDILDADEAISGDCIADRNPKTGLSVLEEVSRQSRRRFRNTQFYTAKINGAISDNHQFQISGFGNPRAFDKDFYRLTGAPESTLYKLKDGAYDVSAKWTSKFAGGKTQLDIVGGYHLGYEKQDPYFAGGSAKTGQQFQNLRNMGNFAATEVGLSNKCIDGSPGDLYPGITNCPVIGYTQNGLGFLETRDNGRASLTGSLTQRVKLLGHHSFKLGGDVELTTYNSSRRFTGDTFYQWRRPGAGLPRQWRRRSLIEVNTAGTIPCLGTMCQIAPGGIQADTKDRNIGAYLQDSWQIRPNFTVNAGVRWEKQTGYVADGIQGLTSPEGEVIPKVAFDLSNMIAPRIGVIWDPTSDGRAKIMAHYGRFYESVPMDINIRAFGGEITDESFLDCTAANITATQAQLDACTQFSRVNQLGGGTEYVAPSMRGQYINEVILGTEYELMADFKMGVNFVARNMPIVIEDVSTDGGSNYLIANPGEDFSKDADALRAKAMGTTNAGLKALYLSRADQLDSVKDFDKPIRDYQALQITAQQRFSKSAMLLASYTYSRSKGNYPGLFSTETGQLDPNLTSLYDLPELMSNRYGALGLDRPHNLKIDGFYQFDFKAAGALTLGASIRGQSGLAHNTLAAHPVYGPDESYLLPRGSGVRSPFTWGSDVKATYGHKIGKRQSLEVFADVFNLLNSQIETDTDEGYTLSSSAADPIVGGDASDLRHAKSSGSGTSPELNKNYGNLNARQAPRSFRFGLRYSF
jgi:Carboxypeptidase regulatory-like domain/TonB dependent receptor